MPSSDLRRIAVELAAELSDETAAAIFPVLTDCANELDALRAKADRLQALIDAYAAMEPNAEDALLAAATKEDDRG